MADEERVRTENEDTRGVTTQTNVRLTPDEKKRIDELIQQGKFTTRSNFIRSAIYEKLNREEYMAKFHESLLEDFNNPETRARFRKILAEILTHSVSD